MGLKDLLLQGQTTLSAGSFPGDIPINDPQSGFVQENSPNNTYEDETIGQPDNGSVLATTLGNTSLDNTQPLFDTATLPPSTVITDYPSLASGEFGGASSQYTPIYNSNNTYLNSITDINSTPQVNTLGQTGLDNTNTNAVPTTVVPNNISYPNNYPPLVSGEFNGAPSQYVSPYNPNNTYLNSIITTDTSPQIDALGQTGLDVEDTNAAETTTTPNNITSPNNYGNLPNSPSVQLGEYGGAPSQYTSPYTPNNSYLSQIDSPDFNGVQVAAITGSGLDTDLINAAETTFTVPLPDTITIYPADNVTHNTLTSGTDSAPKYYNQIWSNQNSYWNFFQDSPESFNPNTENKFQGNYDALGRLLNRLSNRIRR